MQLLIGLRWHQNAALLHCLLIPHECHMSSLTHGMLRWHDCGAWDEPASMQGDSHLLDRWR